MVYHKTAHRAFTFCDKFKRKVEFRRLCEMLRTHLGNLSKGGLGPAAINDKRLRGWDGWTDDSVEMHLTTRFKQLEVGVILEQLEVWGYIRLECGRAHHTQPSSFSCFFPPFPFLPAVDPRRTPSPIVLGLAPEAPRPKRRGAFSVCGRLRTYRGI